VCDTSAPVGYRVVSAEEHPYEDRPGHEGQQPRRAADVTTSAGLQQSRARIWRYPPHTRGRRHRDRKQEEVFVVLEGRLTLLLGEPPERVDLEPQGVVSVEAGTALQLRNETDEEVVVFAYGAPPIAGAAEFLDDVPAL
jgi:mannose-6-phosphate isomerase-like protein (cupin superfamily)